MHTELDKCAELQGHRQLLEEGELTVKAVNHEGGTCTIKISRADGYEYMYVLYPRDELKNRGKEFPPYDPLLKRLLDEGNTDLIAKIYKEPEVAHGR